MHTAYTVVAKKQAGRQTENTIFYVRSGGGDGSGTHMAFAALIECLYTQLITIIIIIIERIGEAHGMGAGLETVNV